LALAPNLRFSAPELAKDSKCSTASDVFSLGALIYFLVQMDAGHKPYIVDIENPYLESQFLAAI